MSSSVRIQTGDTETIVASILDASLSAITGKTDILISIWREKGSPTGQFLDWNDMTFKIDSWTTRRLAMTELDDAYAPGDYYVDLDTSTITNAIDEDVYHARVEQSPGTDARNMPQFGEIKVGQWTDFLDGYISSCAVPGDAMDLIADAVDSSSLATSAVEEIDGYLSTEHGGGSWEGSTAAVVADAVWDEDLSGHSVAGSAGQTLQDAYDTILDVRDAQIAATALTIAGSSTTIIQTDLAKPNGFYDKMFVQIISGTNTAVRPIDSYLLASGAIFVDDPLPFTPSPGDVVLILTKYSEADGSAN